MKQIKRTILTFTGCYLPGYLGGGPIRTIASMVEILGDEFDFKIVTLDRDLDSNDHYPEISVDDWQKVGKAEVFYVSPGNANITFIRRLINSTEHDVLYLNSFFSPLFAIIPIILRRFRLVESVTTIIAPRGEFSFGALNIKSFKKRLYLLLSKTLKLYKNVVWQASSPREMENIITVFGSGGKSSNAIQISIAPNLSMPKQTECDKVTKDKQPGSLKIVFLSRISPMKNLDGALRMLDGLSGDIRFSIFGPLEDMNYWGKCQRIIDTLPSNIHVSYEGSVEPDKVVSKMSQYDLFFLPTHGENFGHVIVEALVAGCPILISDQTPWRELEKEGVGWDLSLKSPEKFTAVLRQCVDMQSEELGLLSNRAREYGLLKSMDKEVIQQNRNLFNSKPVL